nr:matrix metalloproteinase-9-like [Pogona vitticeps]
MFTVVERCCLIARIKGPLSMKVKYWTFKGEMAFKKISLWCINVLLPLLVAGEEFNPIGPCVFPFTYNGKSYSSCTTVGESSGKPWCSLTSNYNADRKWKYCNASEFNPIGPCVFPFTYNGKSYSSCTTVGESSGKPWCSLTSNYNTDRKWKYCNTSDLNYKGRCVFPFIYNGKSYSSCTTAGDSDGRLWCSLTSNYDADHKWKYCNPSCWKMKMRDEDARKQLSNIFNSSIIPDD